MGQSLIYNIPGNYETTNLALIKKILGLLNKSDELISFVKDRPGHDRRYSITSNHLRKEIGFRPKLKFENGLQSTISWYISNKKRWVRMELKKIKNPTPWLD